MVNVSLQKQKIKFLILEGVHQRAINNLRAAGYDNIEYHEGALSTEELIAVIPDVHFIGIRSRIYLSEQVLAVAEKLVVTQLLCQLME